MRPPEPPSGILGMSLHSKTHSLLLHLSDVINNCIGTILLRHVVENLGCQFGVSCKIGISLDTQRPPKCLCAFAERFRYLLHFVSHRKNPHPEIANNS